MKTISRRTLCVAAALAAGLSSLAAATTPTPAPIPVAHSTLLTIDATPSDQGLALHIKHAGNQIPIDGRDVTVSVDGKNVPVTAEPEGTFLLSSKDLDDSDGLRQFDITVAHDGIREILTGKVALPKAGGAADLMSSHKQIAWWILNIAIVLVAAMMFSRRGSKPAKDADEDD
jgi:hypothetical protein